MNQRLKSAPFAWLVTGLATAFIVMGLAMVVYVGTGGRVGHSDSDLAALGYAVMGIAGALLGAFILVLATRQLVLGLPKALVTSSGIALGSHLIRWDEVESVGEARLFGLCFIGIVVSGNTLARLSILDRLSADRMKGGRVLITLSEAQLGISIKSANRAIRELRLSSGTAPVPRPSDIHRR